MHSCNTWAKFAAAAAAATDNMLQRAVCWLRGECSNTRSLLCVFERCVDDDDGAHQHLFDVIVGYFALFI